MTLQTELERVREYLTDANKRPANETVTRNRVIRPLLLQCGYDHHEIDEEVHDPAGGIIDFVVLPKTAHTWFLEAKKWSERLSDANVIQTINYAHTQGKRWVVLSNGREWRLYDDHIIGGDSADRLVTIARLNCGTELEDLLAALSKDAVQSGALEAYALTTRLAALLRHELATANSDVIQAITEVCKSKSGLSAVTSANVAAYFHTPTTKPVPPAPPIQPVSVPKPPSTNGLTMPELLAAGNAVQGKQPDSLVFPDSSAKSISTWRELTLGIIEWLFTQGKSPALPFRGQNGGTRCFINTTPFHPNGAKMAHKMLDVNGQALYIISVHRSAPEFLRCLVTLCEEVGEPPEGFRVTLQ